MFDFVEKNAVITSEYPMLKKKSDNVVVQGGIQPVAFVQQDINDSLRPRSLLKTRLTSSKKIA